MTYAELKERAILLRKYGFKREQFSKSYRKTIHQGDFHHRRRLPYIEIKTVIEFRGFLLFHIDDMENELREYVLNHKNN